MEINENMAYCGLTCNNCPIHLATLEKYPSRKQILREAIAKECSEHYGMPMPASDITDCDGCKAVTGILFSGCLKCEIRKCAVNKQVDNCAFCNDYACERLLQHFTMDAGAQKRLEEIRKGFEN